MIDIIGLTNYVMNAPLKAFGLSLAYPWVIILEIPILLLLFWFINKTLLSFPTEKEKHEYVKNHRALRIIVLITRTIIVLLILIAIASPFSSRVKTEKGDTTLTLLVDRSTSFELFNDNMAEQLKTDLEGKIPVEVRYLAYGNDSSIGDALMNNIQGNDNVLIISDGNSNAGKSLGDMMLFAKNLNATISSIDVSPEKSDLAVTIDGPRESIYGNEMVFYVDVNNVGPDVPYHIKVMINDGVMLEEDATGTKTFEFKQRLIPGYHKIIAEITADDYFNENNIFYKTIHVLPQPHILLVSRGNTMLEDLFDKVYRVSRKYDIPSDLSDYDAVILNDISNDLLENRFNTINNYVDDGNGLVVIGGRNAYDRGGYMNNIIETLLPVDVGVTDQDEDKDVNIVIVIDISGTTTFDTGSGTQKLSVQKAQALAILRNIKPEHYVGVVAFDTHGYYVTTKLLPLGEQKDLNETIRKIKAEPGAGTFIAAGLQKAFYLLESARGSRNVILISDGITDIPAQALADARMMDMHGINIYTVGVGSDTDVSFMRSLAESAGGKFYQTGETHKLSIVFGGEAEETNENQLVIMDSNHFITENLNLDAEVTGYNQVVPKNSAKDLVMTRSGFPIITIWRFGLGRVVAYTTDDGTRWSGELLQKGNSNIITRTVNWAIGNPERNSDFEVQVRDSHVNRPAEIYVFARKVPVHDNLTFSKIDENTYHAYFRAEKPGFYSFYDAIVAVNYDDEYTELGLNPELKNLVTVTGGSIFQMNDTEKLVDFVRETSKRTKTTVTYYRWQLIIAALVLFLVEVGIRRLFENKKV